MKTKFYLYTLLLALMAMVGTSCVDRLNIPKHGSLGGPEDYYQTDEEVLSAAASMYASLREHHYNWFFVLNCMSDDVWTGGGQRNDNADMEKLNEFNYDIDHGMIQALYSGLYAVIYKANLIIDNATGTSDTMRQVVAEAHFIRGWAHFYLVTLWGTAPIVDHLLAVDEYRQTNSTPEALWAFVESEFETAINSGAMLSKSSANDTGYGGRPTLETAKAYLGKAYLFQGKYAEAAKVLDEVIDSKKYDLYRGDYDLLGHAATDNCCEAIFEIQRRNNPEQAWTQFSQQGIMLGWRTSILTYSSDFVANERIASGTYGFMNPTKNLYDAFVEMEGADGYRLNSTIRTYQQMNDMGVINMTGAALVGNEGYFMWKTRLLLDDCLSDNPGLQMLQYNNLRIMRYAEVLLMAAEAHVMSSTGDVAKATNYVNQIRERAHLTPLPTVTMDDIKKEKRLELCLESVRYQDLVRWGDAETVLGEQGRQIPSFRWEIEKDEDGNIIYDAQGKTTIVESEVSYPNNNSIYGFKERNKLLPIPLKELEVNSSMHQNAGWD